jgi:magnesium and cobalt transporter
MSPRREPSEPPSTKRSRWWRRAGADGDGDGRRGGGRGEQGHATEASASADEQERIILDALADLRDMDVREVMTPRVDVTYLTIPVHAEDIAQAVRTTGHSCFPVVHDDLDDLIGILFVNDIFRTGGSGASRRDRGGVEPASVAGSASASASARERDATDPSPLEISRKIRPAHLVPETLGVLEALADMRKHRRAVAVVVDEYGGVAGLLTMKDLLEPLVGELHDEFDEEEESSMVRVDNARWLIDGQTNVDEVRERLGIDIPEDGEYVTLGGLLFQRFGHIPTEGEDVRIGDWDLKVVEMDKRRVAQVVATFVGGDAAPGPGPGDSGGAPEKGSGGSGGPAPLANGSGEAAG